MNDIPTRADRFVPVNTYRLQMHAGFRFRDAAAIVPYLARLGVTHVYSSPYFQARPGSTHGYDICDHNALNPEIGSDDDYRHFIDTLHAHGLGHVIDVVPNHMGLDPVANAWWSDVLEGGTCSPYADHFDIDWQPVKAELHDKILLPVLADQYGRVLERGELRVIYESGRLRLDYNGSLLPVNPRQSPRVLRIGLEALEHDLGETNGEVHEFLSILTSLDNLPAYTERDPQRVAERQREKEVARQRLERLVDASSAIRAHVERAIAAANGRPGDPASFDVLHGLLEAQPYRLSYWRTAAHEINYRRFFDVNDLGGVRVELHEVFNQVHALLGRLLAAGAVDAVRIDHADGLYDPTSYFERLHALAAEARATPAGAAAPPLWLAAEKILSKGEHLPASWQVDGTTGYEVLNLLQGLFVDPEGQKTLVRVYRRLTGLDDSFDDIVYATKRLIMDTSMASELNVLAHALNRISERNRRSRDFTLNSLRDVLVEFVACLPVYRTYVTAEGWTTDDARTIDVAIGRARRRNPAMESSIFDFLRAVILPTPPDAAADEAFAPRDADEFRAFGRFAMQLQQYTGPVQAKGVEDTAFYRHNVLLALNEVGGEPSRFGVSAPAFHSANIARHLTHPRSMVTTGTHDTKLGEDVRARIAGISELAEDWRREVSRWIRITARERQMLDGDWAPDRNDEYRFYQVLMGAWPASADIDSEAPPELVTRLQAYMVKAIREAKVHTSWLTQNLAYEEAVTRFVERVLTGPTGRRFLAAALPFQRRLARIGLVNSLSQVLLRATVPGVADLYQGSELWDLNLVDPDNRRPVDFGRRAALLTSLERVLPLTSFDEEDTFAEDRHAAIEQMLAAWPDGRIKLYLTAIGLRARRRWPALFLDGAYTPCDTDVTVPAGLVAFARHHGDTWLLAVAPRLASRLVGVGPDDWPTGEMWKTSRVLMPPGAPSGAWVNLLTGERCQPMSHRGETWLFAGDALRRLPVALLATRPPA
jgi:(1->4)-alpha-D-glucan 1-alpha-D-glucosylmutase